MSEIEAIILAAGCSSRMKTNKLLLPFGEVNIITRFLTNFPYRLFTRTFVVVSSPEVTECTASFPVSCVFNHSPQQGQSSSIRIGLEAGNPENAVLFAVADQPLLHSKTIDVLVQTFLRNSTSIVQPRVGSKPANPVLFPADLRQELAQLQGDTGGRKIIQNHTNRVKAVYFPESLEFHDIDTEHDYKQLVAEWQRNR